MAVIFDVGVSVIKGDLRPITISILPTSHLH